ncbi:hypothetical protein, partial [Actinophytocola sp.]|uniref:hypothetical protein n=1 Tax=Actinophytocola sp. TaxID=1872138 RepID=UPI0025C41F1C
LLGATPGDTLDDLFPGSGAVTRAWHTFTQPHPNPPNRAAPPDPSHQDRADASRQVLHDASRHPRGGHDTSRPPAGATQRRTA